MKFTLRVGERVGRLTLMSSFMRGNFKHWVCRCDCGGSATPLGDDTMRAIVSEWLESPPLLTQEMIARALVFTALTESALPDADFHDPDVEW